MDSFVSFYPVTSASTRSAEDEETEMEEFDVLRMKEKFPRIPINAMLTRTNTGKSRKSA